MNENAEAMARSSSHALIRNVLAGYGGLMESGTLFSATKHWLRTRTHFVSRLDEMSAEGLIERRRGKIDNGKVYVRLK